VPTAILSQLVRGELPCPPISTWKAAVTEGPDLVVKYRGQAWRFSRSESDDLPLPVRVVIHPQSIELAIEDWDVENHYARKVKVMTSQGSMKWTWRSHEVEPK